MFFLLIFNVLYIILYAVWFGSRFENPYIETYFIDDIKYYRGESLQYHGADSWYELIEHNKHDFLWTEEGKKVNDPDILNKLNTSLLTNLNYKDRKKDRALGILLFLDFFIGLIIYELNYLPSDY